MLCLCLAHPLLFSSAGDAIVQVWHADTFANLHTIYSTFDVGDVFCVAFSHSLQTAWFGAQNTSIQWLDLANKPGRRRPSLTSHPSRRVHRFFDSMGPGGRRTPRPSADGDDDGNSGSGSGGGGCHGGGNPDGAGGARGHSHSYSAGSGAAAAAAAAGTMLEVEPSHICQYAHYGYVYCMLLVPASRIGQGSSGHHSATSHSSTTSTSSTSSNTSHANDHDEVLLSGGGDGDVKLWRIDRQSGAIAELHTLAGSGDAGVLSIVAKDTLLYCGLTDGEICIWDLDTLQLVRTVRAHCDDVLTLCVQGASIFSGSASGYVRVNRPPSPPPPDDRSCH